MSNAPAAGMMKVVSGATVDEERDALPVPHIDTAAGLSIHPGQLEPLRKTLLDSGVDEFARTAFQAAFGALEHANESVSAMAAARAECASRDPKHRHMGEGGKVTLGIEPSLVPDLISAVNESYMGGARRIEAAEKAIAKAGESLNAKIAASISDPRKNEASRVQLGSEIRTFLRGMPFETARIGWVQQRISEGDRDEVTAIFTGSPFASGLDKKMFAELRTMAEGKFAPREVEARAALGTLREKMNSAGAAYYSRYASVVPKQAPQHARSSEALQRLKKGAA